MLYVLINILAYVSLIGAVCGLMYVCLSDSSESTSTWLNFLFGLFISLLVVLVVTMASVMIPPGIVGLTTYTAFVTTCLLAATVMLIAIHAVRVGMRTGDLIPDATRGKKWARRVSYVLVPLFILSPVMLVLIGACVLSSRLINM